MIIIGCDYHPSFEQIAFVDTETGELQERRLQHREEAEKFYRDLAAQEMKVRVGMEASGHARWFERLLSELQIELWIGDAAEISSRRVRKQKTDTLATLNKLGSGIHPPLAGPQNSCRALNKKVSMNMTATTYIHHGAPDFGVRLLSPVRLRGL
jgi:hypothetical protein